MTEFHHAGYASRKDGTIKLVSNNAIGTKMIKSD